MARLLKIFVTSLGGGIALGWAAGAMAKNGKSHSVPESNGSYPAGKGPETVLEARIAQMEERLDAVESRVQTASSSPASALEERLGELEATLRTHDDRLRTLQECSIQSEQNLQRLMAGIERLVNAQTRSSNDAGPVADARKQSGSAVAR